MYIQSKHTVYTNHDALMGMPQWQLFIGRDKATMIIPDILDFTNFGLRNAFTALRGTFLQCHTVCSIDNPGYGKSGRLVSAYSWMINDVLNRHKDLFVGCTPHCYNHMNQDEYLLLCNLCRPDMTLDDLLKSLIDFYTKVDAYRDDRLRITRGYKPA